MDGLSEERLRRIRIVSGHFPQLQGLRLCAWGVSFGLAALLPLALPGRFGLMTLIGVAGVCFLPSEWIVRRYYRDALGRSVPKGDARYATLAAIGLAVSSAVVANVFDVGPLAGGLAFLFAHDLWAVIRDWPFRVHRILTAAAAGFACVVQAVPSLPVDTRVAIGFLIIATAGVPVGVADHRLLMSVMQPSEDTVAESDGHTVDS